MKKSHGNSATIDCLGLGIIPLDILFTIPAFPASGQKVDASSVIVQGGGPVPNTMVGMARLGHKTAVIAAVGNDWAGTVSIEELRNERVNTGHIIVKKTKSAMAAGFIESGSGQRTIALYRNISVYPRDLKTADYPLPRIIHLDGRDLDACVRLAKWGRKAGALISFDVGSMRNDVSPIFPLVDHLVVADAFAMPFTRTNSARSAIVKLARRCPGEIVITEGIKGSLGWDRERFHFQPAFRVKNVDTTGAGDAFHAGYLHGLLRRWSMPERLRFGAGTAALKCTRPGARTGAPRLNQVIRFLKMNAATYA
ncbi:MAG: PfkB family carbohydrate kinase [Candidatus Zixiibacteriota bacterium]